MALSLMVRLNGFMEPEREGAISYKNLESIFEGPVCIPQPSGELSTRK